MRNKTKQKRNLVVTAIDKNYINQAKQLFSSIYWNAGWEGDYMLLAYKIPKKDLKWFKNRGILVKKYNFKLSDHACFLPPVIYLRYNLFKEEFKKWNGIIYLDSDIIVRGPIDKMIPQQGFSAVADIPGLTIKSNINQETKNEKEEIKIIRNNLKKSYSLDKKTFNAGVFAFNTSIIDKETFHKILYLSNKYKKISKMTDQLVLNLFFYNNWHRLPLIYNVFIVDKFGDITKHSAYTKGIIIHAAGRNKPWNENNPFYKEWKSNLNKANLINLKKRPETIEKWPKPKIIYYSSKILLRNIKENIKQYTQKEVYKINRRIGQIGIIIKKYSPRAYLRLIEFKLNIRRLFSKKNSFQLILEHTVIDCLKKDDLIIDAGANEGRFSEEIHKMNPRNTLVLIEPDPELSKELALKYSRDKNVDVIPAALTHKNSNSVKLYINKDKIKNSVVVSLVSQEQTKAVPIKTITLKDLYKLYPKKKIGLLKMDIEGAEWDILNKFSSSDYQKIDQISVEFHDFLKPEWRNKTIKCIQKMKKLGYSFSKFENQHIKGYMDCLFYKKHILEKARKVSFRKSLKAIIS